MFTQEYLKLLSIKKIRQIFSKPYGFELLILLYDFTKHELEYGVEETLEPSVHSGNLDCCIHSQRPPCFPNQ